MKVKFLAKTTDLVSCTLDVQVPNDIKTEKQLQSFLYEYQREIDGGEYTTVESSSWDDYDFEVISK